MLRTLTVLAIIATVLILLACFFSPLSASDGVLMSARVEDNSKQYLVNFVSGRKEWVEDWHIVEDSKCWVHWLPCDDIEMCVRDAMFCVPFILTPLEE